MFSVVIPLYNKAESITATLKSVLAQSFENFEIVLVNDGSTDGSLEVAKKIQDPRIRIIEKENGGVSSARNKGIREAKYEWIAFLDGDDLWMKDHLMEFSRAIITDPNLSWLFSGYTAKNSVKSYDFIYKSNGRLMNVFDDLLNNIKIHTSTVCVRKTLFTENQDLYFREGVSNSEDREVWYKLCFIDQSPYYIDKSLSIYKLDDTNSLTKLESLNPQDFFLTMKVRIRESILFQKMSAQNKIKISTYIDNFNKKGIIGIYLRTADRLRPIYKNYFSSTVWFILHRTRKFPNLIKKIISKFL